jgi:hypothetical protein
MSDPGSGIGGSNPNMPIGRPPPSDDEFYLEWGRENTKAAIANANIALGQLLTASTALFGGTIAFWNYFPIQTTYRFIALAAALVTVLICLFAAMPRKTRFDLTSAPDIRGHMEDVFTYKARPLAMAKWSLVITLLLMVLGLVLGGALNRTVSENENPQKAQIDSTATDPIKR